MSNRHTFNAFTQPPRPGTGDYTRRHANNPNAHPNNNFDAPFTEYNEGHIELSAEPLQETKTMVTNNGNAAWTRPAEGALEFLNEQDRRRNQLENRKLDNEIEIRRLENEDNNNQRNTQIALARQQNMQTIINGQLAIRDQTHRHQYENRQQRIDSGYHYDATAAQMADREFYRDLVLQQMGVDLDNLRYKDTGISDDFRENLPNRTFDHSVLAYGVQNIQYGDHKISITFVDDIRDGIEFSLGKGWFVRPLESLYYKGVYLIRFGKDPTIRKIGKVKRSFAPRNCCERIYNSCTFQ